jgi:hypothetical protein
MRRDEATKKVRELFETHNLTDWKVRVSTELRPGKVYAGLCSYQDKCIILNAHHIDTHPDFEVEDTIKHEIAHALTQGHGHDEVWQAKAQALGCSNLTPVCGLALSYEAIEAIRSGHLVEPVVEEVVHVEKKVTYKITKLQEKCPHCGKVAVEKHSFEHGDKKFITLECGHLIVKVIPKGTPFETITFDGDPNCKHSWDTPFNVEYKTVCGKCNAKRPYKFQLDSMRILERFDGRFGIFHEQGLGKTIVTLGYIKFHQEATPFVWICKSGLKFQAAKEIMRVLGPSYIPYIFDTGNDFIFPGFKCYIISYDLLRRMSRENIEKLKGIIKCAVLDECQHIKNPDSTRTQEVRNLVRDLRHIIPLSGTFWKNRGSEAYVALNLINPVKFNSFERFKAREVRYSWVGTKKKEQGLMPGFRERCADVFTRYERQEVMKELPLINRTKLYAQMPKEAMERYEDQMDDFIKIWNAAVLGGEENSFKTGGSVLAALNAMRQTIGLAKVPVTVEFAEEFLEETDRKLVIFVHHIHVGTMIYDQMKKICEEKGIKLFRLSSDMKPEDRFHMCEEFNKEKQCVLVASTLASGEGLNLQTCSDCIMHERQWNPANEEQAEGRFIRIGQLSDMVTATYVQAEDSVDEDLDVIVSNKRIAFHESMNKGEMPTWNQDSIIKLVGAATAERWRKRNRKVGAGGKR